MCTAVLGLLVVRRGVIAQGQSSVQSRNMKTALRLHSPLAALIIVLTISSAFAGSATWSTSPTNGNWNSGANWSPMTVPDGPADTATFGSSSVTNISLSADTEMNLAELNGMVFNPGASAYTITARTHIPDELFLSIGGVGIINNSGVIQHFVTATSNLGYDAALTFENDATAGNMTVFTFNGDG